MEYNRLPKDIKLATYSFIVGFIISFLIGAVTRNPLGIVSFRAFISGVLFGGLVYAGLYLLRRYIPELEIAAVDRKANGAKDADQKADDVKAPENTEGSALEYAAEDKKKVSQHIKIDEPDQIMGEGEKKSERAPITAETEKDTGEEGLPSLDRLFEEEETVPDLEVEKEVVKEDKRIIGDYINLGNARIPNEPEVLAKAIKKVMKEDER